jgi:DNA-binding response OmpR family regulator
MKKILVIDDAEETIWAVKESLSLLGLTIHSSGNIKDGLARLKKANDAYSLIIIDINLPDGSGFDFFQSLSEIEKHKNTPVFFLTGSKDVESKIKAFSMGADDYVVKPFNLLELCARVERRLFKQEKDDNLHKRIVAGPIILEINAQRVKIAGRDGFISMTPIEFKILLLLVKNPDQIFSREEILSLVWGKDIFVADRTVDAHVCYVRKKLENYFPLIQSVPGEGYRFVFQSAL